MRHLALTLPVLVERGWEVGLLAFGGRISPSFVKELSAYLVECRSFGGNLGSVVLRAVPLIRRVVERFQPDVVFLHAFAAGVAGRVALSCGKVCVVYVPHAFSWHRPQPFWKRVLARWTERLLARRCSWVGCVGPADVADALRVGVPTRRVVSCPNGLPDGMVFVDREEARRHLGLSLEGPLGVFPARLEIQKGVMTLLQAVKLSREGEYRMVCFGDGSQRRLAKRFVDENGLGDKVLLRGETWGLWRYLLAFDFLVMPSFYEGSSYAVLEAEAAGLPIVMSDIVGAPDNALRFPAGDAEALARILAGGSWKGAAVGEWRVPRLDEQVDGIVERCSLK